MPKAGLPASPQQRRRNAVPDRHTCYRLMAEEGMLPNIREHSERVAQVALLLADHLNRKGEHLDPALVEAAALLHDITKTRSLRTHEPHDRTGEERLRALGYPEVAQVVGQHVFLSPECLSRDFVSEAEVIFYADKRVKHTAIVGIEDRYLDLEHRYARTERDLRRIRRNLEFARRLEAKLFARLDFPPDKLEQKLHETG